MRAAEEALKHPTQPFLLHVDEINRADLAKILGEAIFLLESQADEKRELDLAYDFGPPFGNRFSHPREPAYPWHDEQRRPKHCYRGRRCSSSFRFCEALAAVECCR